MVLKEILKVIPSNVKIDFFKEHGVFKYNAKNLTGNEKVTEIEIEATDKIIIYFEDTDYEKLKDKITKVIVNPENEADKYLLEIIKERQCK